MDIKLMPDKYKEKGISGGSKLPGAGLSGFFGAKGGLLSTLPFILLIVVILACFGLWGYKISLDKGMESLVQRFEELQEQRDLDLETGFMELKERIEVFRSILKERTYSLNVLEMLEESTLPQVYYTNFDVDLAKFTIGLGAEAADYDTMAKQIVVFEDDSRITDVIFSEVGLKKSGWVNSTLELGLNPDFLYE